MSQKVMITRVATVLLMGMALTGCSTMKGWFAGRTRPRRRHRNRLSWSSSSRP